MNHLKFILTLAVGLTLSAASLAQTTQQVQEETHPPISSNNLHYTDWQTTRIYQKEGIDPLSQSEWLEIRAETAYHTVPPDPKKATKSVHLYKCYPDQDCERLARPIPREKLKTFLTKANSTSIGFSVLALALTMPAIISLGPTTGAAAVAMGAAGAVGLQLVSGVTSGILIGNEDESLGELTFNKFMSNTVRGIRKVGHIYRNTGEWIISPYKNGSLLRKLLSKKDTLFVKDLKKLEDELKNIIHEAL